MMKLSTCIVLAVLVVMTLPADAWWRRSTNVKPGCVNANWWVSFNKQGWSTCDTTNQFITGFYRSALSANYDGLYRLEEAKCCKSSPIYIGQKSTCQNANWWDSFNKKGWNVCSNGYFLNGLYRTNGQNLHNLEEGKCCKPVNHPDKYGDCYHENIKNDFNKKGWTVCKKDGYYVTGLRRDSGNWLKDIDSFKCCKMWSANVKPGCVNANWWVSFNKQGWSTCDTTNQFITGFYRSALSANYDGLYRLEEAKCCKSSPIYIGQKSTCQNANWWDSFNKKGWNVCSNGYFLNGLYRTNGQNLHNLEEGKCCKPVNHPDKYGDCYHENIKNDFNKKGWTVCKKDGYYVTGLRRDSGNWLKDIDSFKCCKMWSANVKPGCVNANWWVSFNKQGWSTCDTTNQFITGFYRSALSANYDGLYRLEEAKCCKSSPIYIGQKSTCQNANWWDSFNKKGWSVCSNGYFLNGLYRTNGQNLHNLEEGKCCKPINHPDKYGDCYHENIKNDFNKKGWTVCKKDGYYVTGLRRDSGNWLKDIDSFKCCKMWSC
ncbi:uncharacterized protein LOC124457749 isoform X2 [Xenia sp. Carnegie-2017]|nr:uncharacterized protein LOC124457749 isoform X2 [Xenia sp. Carnegie-2017]